MTNIAHLTETAFLLLAAYLAGCMLGYAARRILHAARGTRQVAAVASPVATPAPPPRRSPTAAARLAATVDEPLEKRAPPTSRPVAARSALAKEKLPGQRPPSLAAPRDGIVDNLMQIKGIGPKIEASLHGLGIFHIDQIAGWTRAHADWVDARLGYGGRIRRERWVEQAIALARTKAVA
jgi:predicted flap endonuclease-1-like 5' DNA nuclease